MVLHDLPQNESRVELDDKVKLTAKPTPVEASFSILGGEIVGIAGLMGSGRTALPKAIFGLSSSDVDARSTRSRHNKGRSLAKPNLARQAPTIRSEL
jgi:ABC-type sugar transport system ATPase subunit